MFRANVYMVEKLSVSQKTALAEGVEVVAHHIGERVTTNFIETILPRNAAGKVRTKDVVLASLDEMVELHLHAVPLVATPERRIGVASYARGVGFVDSAQNTLVVRNVATHETAHAFGFVRTTAWQRDIESPMHCCSKDCIMHSLVKEPDMSILYKAMEKIEKHDLDDLDKVKEEYEASCSSQVFCNPCRADLHDFGEENLSVIRMGRLLSKEILFQ
jgi:hypothetical protein